ncbi:hypothetical protein [Nonomuraea zeae]|uniref:Polysaccharide chain length determinant N-terminal domain-containing protein n=1 Tax=Nonomuraea zeae TaxID=1642303 RepID=A0A5S4G8E9_9ACTN|nr:hypothetical protein [Nonomuraea zeae]TMR29295.1 hypothetical protein ETD85_32900 [Nonomuraea zeae]
MDFWATVSVLFRRWYVTLPAFVLTAAGALGVFSMAPKTFVSTSAMVLTLPVSGASVPSDPDFPNPRSNPLVSFDQGLSMTTSILIQALTTPELAAKVGAPIGGDTTLKVTSGGTNPELMPSTPFIIITVEAPSAELAHGIVTKVTDLAKQELRLRQAQVNAPPTTYVTATVVVPPTTPDEKKGSRMRTAVVMAALGFFTSLLAAFAAESFVRHRRARRTPGEPSPPGLGASNGAPLLTGRQG